METKEIVTKNALIAEFMGWEVSYKDLVNYPKENHNYTICLNGTSVRFQQYGELEWLKQKVKLHYDSSWDWLMPVWFKFRDLKTDNDTPREFKSLVAQAITETDDKGCKAAHAALVEGIQWYNTQK